MCVFAQIDEAISDEEKVEEDEEEIGKLLKGKNARFTVCGPFTSLCDDPLPVNYS